MNSTHSAIAPHSSVQTAQSELDDLRAQLRARYVMQEPEVVNLLMGQLSLSDASLDLIQSDAADLVSLLREHNKPTMMESFLSEYGLSTPEGVGLMCLAEALLRVPDAATIDELIADKLESSDWAAHLGQSSSPLVNASTWALLLTGRLLDDSEQPTRSLTALLKRVGEPVVRTAVGQSMKLLGRQFVLGQNIQQAIEHARALEQKGYTYSYDMLGEAAHTFDDAQRYTQAYADAIEHLSHVPGESIREKPGISVKLSALHPRYEYSHRQQVMSELLPIVSSLARQAAQAGIGFNIDAEEADRLDLSLDVIDALLQDPALAGWDGLGVVVQAYSRRALPVIDWLLAATRLADRKIMVRLVKGAYWDSEIKQAQELGLASFPVFTRKSSTDVSYLCCAERLLANREYIYPQFATHNAHSVCAILRMAGNDTHSYEFQRLHGMGESLHERVHQQHQTRCRIYAPVGAHRDLLAYLVRRLLENGANSSFVNQIVDHRIAPETVARCPVREVRSASSIVHPAIAHPLDIYQPQRANSKGFRINDPASVEPLLNEREAFVQTQWSAAPLLHDRAVLPPDVPVYSPNDASDLIGHVREATADDIEHAIAVANQYASSWYSTSATTRAGYLNDAADAYEAHMAQFCAVLCREAGKTLNDAISEVREAVDFLRYYAAVSCDHEQKRQARSNEENTAHGVVVCVSPWNFPLAIFTGQIAGALAAGNAVLAKPAEQTPLVAAQAVTLLLEAGIPSTALQLLPGSGHSVGARLTSDPAIGGVCFTGSTATSRHIERALAARSPADLDNGANPNPLLMAETGGLNAMIVDSSALTEQVVRDSVMSAFQSAGQRCSALRILYVQKEAEQRLITMLKGAMDTLVLGHPWMLSTDVGPVIDKDAHDNIHHYVEAHRKRGTVLHQGIQPSEQVATDNLWISPTLLKVNGIADMEKEIFGPVLHIATYNSDDLSSVVADINNSGYGLTFGLHTRIDDRVQQVIDTITAGNVYVNRNQIGAVVGSQPFGGEVLSGTGPKAGGPWYVPRLMNVSPFPDNGQSDIAADWLDQVMPGPTGESNHWRAVPRSPVLLINEGSNDNSDATASVLQRAGCQVIAVASSEVADTLVALVNDHNIAVVLAPDSNTQGLLGYRQQLASSDGPLIPLISNLQDMSRFFVERHVCVDTTAAGGNASLLGST